MLTILKQPEITHNLVTDTISTSYLLDGSNLEFKYNTSKIKVDNFTLRIQRTEIRKLTSLQIEIKNLSFNKLMELGWTLNVPISPEDCEIADKIVIRLTISKYVLETFINPIYYTSNNLNELLNVKDAFGANALLNLNNYSFDKVLDL